MLIVSQSTQSLAEAKLTIIIKLKQDDNSGDGPDTGNSITEVANTKENSSFVSRRVSLSFYPLTYN